MLTLGVGCLGNFMSAEPPAVAATCLDWAAGITRRQWGEALSVSLTQGSE